MTVKPVDDDSHAIPTAAPARRDMLNTLHHACENGCESSGGTDASTRAARNPDSSRDVTLHADALVGKPGPACVVRRRHTVRSGRMSRRGSLRRSCEKRRDDWYAP